MSGSTGSSCWRCTAADARPTRWPRTTGCGARWTKSLASTPARRCVTWKRPSSSRTRPWTRPHRPCVLAAPAACRSPAQLPPAVPGVHRPRRGTGQPRCAGRGAPRARPPRPARRRRRRWPSARCPAPPGWARRHWRCTGRTGWPGSSRTGSCTSTCAGSTRRGQRWSQARRCAGSWTRSASRRRRIPADLDAQAGLYRSLLAGKRVLVVLDNARDAEQVRPLLPGSPGCLAIVTSRDQLAGLVATEGARPLTLDLLTTADARDLLTRRLGRDPGGRRAGSGRRASSPPAPGCRWRWPSPPPAPPPAPASRWPPSPPSCARPAAPWTRSSGGDRATDVRAVFSWSYRALSAEAARLFRLLGLHPGPDIAVAAAASLAAVPPGRARTLLAELTRAHLLTEHAPGRYALHDLLRAYASRTGARPRHRARPARGGAPGA